MPVYAIRDQGDPNATYIVSPSGHVAVVLNRKIVIGQPIHCRSQHGEVTEYNTASHPPSAVDRSRATVE